MQRVELEIQERLTLKLQGLLEGSKLSGLCGYWHLCPHQPGSFVGSFLDPTSEHQVMLTLKIKQWFYQQKWVNSTIPENCNSGQASHSKNHRQVQQNKERNVVLYRKRNLVGVVFNKSPLEKSDSLG